MRNGPSEEAPRGCNDAVRQHRRAFRDIRDEERNIAAGDGSRRTVLPSHDNFAFDQALNLTCAPELADVPFDEEGRARVTIGQGRPREVDQTLTNRVAF